MKFAFSLTGLVMIALLLLAGFWLGKNKPALLGGVI
jgi:hypothetical protein